MAALGIALIVLSLPRLMAAWWALPGNPHAVPVIVGKADGEAVSVLIASRKRALSWTPSDGKLWQELGFGYWRAGDRKAAQEAFEKALRNRPVDGLSWFALARLYHLQGEDLKAARALKLSFWTAPNLPGLYWPRLYLITQLEPAALDILLDRGDSESR